MIRSTEGSHCLRVDLKLSVDTTCDFREMTSNTKHQSRARTRDSKDHVESCTVHVKVVCLHVWRSSTDLIVKAGRLCRCLALWNYLLQELLTGQFGCGTSSLQLSYHQRKITMYKASYIHSYILAFPIV